MLSAILLLLLAACAHRARGEQVAIRALWLLAKAEVENHDRTGRFARLEEIRSTNPELDRAFGWALKRGYRFEFELLEGGFAVRADPTHESAGRRSFYVDQTLELRHSWTDKASSSSEVLK